jgi:hypothetical protein
MNIITYHEFQTSPVEVNLFNNFWIGDWIHLSLAIYEEFWLDVSHERFVVIAPMMIVSIYIILSLIEKK